MSALYLGEMGQATNEVQPIGRWGYHFTKKDEERFWGQVDRTTTPDGCWEFTGERNQLGYGRLWINDRHRMATHVALELAGYIIPWKRLQVRHYICDNPPCVRPDHLKIGTPQDDADDKVSKDRQARGESHGRYTVPERTARGKRNGRAKLDPVKIMEIRRLAAAGGISQRTLGRQFDVSHTNIQRILRGDIWRDEDYGGYGALGYGAVETRVR